MTDSAIDPGLLQAFQDTDYRVHHQPPFVLKIGEANPALVNLYQQHACSRATYVTACNPLSENVGEERNAELQGELADVLREQSLFFIPGVGQSSHGDWSEPSFLVLDLSLNQAEALGRRFRQNALLWCGPDAVPQLILLR